MAWGWKKAADNRPELERLAAEVTELYFAMPASDRAQVATTIRGIIAAAAGLAIVPEELGSALGRTVMRVFTERAMAKVPGFRQPSADGQAEQIITGSAAMLAELGASEADLRVLLGGK